MANKTRKMITTHGVDQISTLPDDVLVRILSLVPTEQAVLTSFLSKRWKFLWTSIPVLDFDYVRFSAKFDDDQKRRFLDFVEHVLFLHELEPLQNLRLAFEISEFDDYISKVSMLVRFAMRSNCLAIDLELSDPMRTLYPEDNEYTLPPCVFPHRSVSQLKLTCCKFVPSLYRGFTSVNVVKLTHVELQKDSVYDLVSKCPCLKELHLIRCQIPSSFFELNAPESNLKCLVLQYCVGNEGLPFEHASIHIPTLLQFKYKGSFRSGYLSIYNSENVIEAELEILRSLRNEHQLLCKLLKGLQNVKSLTLFSYILEVPKNEMLSAVYNVDEETVQKLHLLPPECVAHLMKIKIKNFQGLKVEMEFVKLFLRSSLCLKEMVICMSSRYRLLMLNIGEEHSKKTLKKKKAKVIERLLAYKRVSPDAQILLK
ncbi:hypothetical protein MKX03_013078 [Papaver bracteatum]|nr:hypothetical protein MKX03_013078 [Papaver bracteatum]